MSVLPDPDERHIKCPQCQTLNTVRIEGTPSGPKANSACRQCGTELIPANELFNWARDYEQREGIS